MLRLFSGPSVRLSKDRAGGQSPAAVWDVFSLLGSKFGPLLVYTYCELGAGNVEFHNASRTSSELIEVVRSAVFAVEIL